MKEKAPAGCTFRSRAKAARAKDRRRMSGEKMFREELEIFWLIKWWCMFESESRWFMARPPVKSDRFARNRGSSRAQVYGCGTKRPGRTLFCQSWAKRTSR